MSSIDSSIDSDSLRRLDRRAFFGQTGLNLGAMGLASLLGQELSGADNGVHHPPRAKAVIYLFMAGGPSQLELFEDKPELTRLSGQKPPESFTKDRRFAFLKGTETLLGSRRKLAQHGQCGAVLSDLLPHHREIVDEVCWLKGMTTDVFNHGPAKLFMQTGSPQPGRPSMGSWVTYGIGSEADDLPGFVVLQSGPRGPRGGSALWSSGFLPTSHQGVPFRGQGDPILNLRSPAGFDTTAQREFTDAVTALNRERWKQVGDDEIQTRIAAYEMAYRMQMSAPELMALEREPKHVLEMYGAEPGKSSFANNALLARRLVQRGVRFVQLYHTNWDQHGGAESLDGELPTRCAEVDRGSAALVRDLKEQGMLDDVLVIWGGEFGRTPMGEDRTPTGRDHHIDAFTMWLAGAGVKPGHIHGRTDELGFGVVDGQVHVHDLQATVLHLLGLNHTKLTYRFQGRDFRLTDVHGKVVHDILS
ncbi:MAG: DUF1501 domain-containing protein [Planctomycetales bacterium]|nr:DUF1501 domain-containing protein [Planctomycetales bacterium]